ncbi:hypothetical protein [Kitasatospora sp. NBC_01300]|uniref:hypothetical protein n=1 Tax=Kitasatospora sp. NBC_01300 TaxID=2903574 RepID=UPI00352E22D7|nr:hypothetical protein OG556_25685 [Kitasatospora sp. NBC_01300]
MNATPRDRSEQTEREELVRLLPAPAAPELPPGRHLLLKEHLMDTVTDNSRRTARRRSLALRLALPAGLAVALTGALLATGPGRHTPDAGRQDARHQDAQHPDVQHPADGTGHELGRVDNAAYTLEGGDDLVKLTILEQYKPVDPDQLQRDLDRFGIPARVYAGQPGCRAPEPEAPDNQEGQGSWDMRTEGAGPIVLTVRPHAVPAGLKLFIYLPFAGTDPAHSSREMHTGLMRSPGPACMPSKVYFNPLASLIPTPPH